MVPSVVEVIVSVFRSFHFSFAISYDNWKAKAKYIATICILLDLCLLSPVWILGPLGHGAVFITSTYLFRAIYIATSMAAIFGMRKKKTNILLPYLMFGPFYIVYTVCCFIPMLSQIPPDIVFVHRWDFHHGSDYVNEQVVKSVNCLHQRIQADVASVTSLYLLFIDLAWWMVFIAYTAIKEEMATAAASSGAVGSSDNGGGTVATSVSNANPNEGEALQAVVVEAIPAAKVGGLGKSRVFDDELALVEGIPVAKESVCGA